MVGNVSDTEDEAAGTINAGKLGSVTFGTSFLANPDLTVHFKTGALLNTPNTDTLYTLPAEDYTGYPSLAE